MLRGRKKIKMAHIGPKSTKNNFFSSPKVAYHQRLYVKKITRIQEIEISHLDTFNEVQDPRIADKKTPCPKGWEGLNDFYVIKSLRVGDLRAEIKNNFFLCGPDTRTYRTILSLLAYAQCTLATIFHFDLTPKKSCFRFLWGPLECVKIAFSNFSLFHWLKLDLVKMAKLACDQLC